MDVSHLYAAVLLCSELLCADGSYRDVGLDLLGVLEEERQRVHAAERRADDHHGAGLQSLTHLSEEHTWSRLTHWSRGRSRLRLTQTWGSNGTDTNEPVYEDIS